MKTDSVQLNDEERKTESDRRFTTIHGKNYKQIKKNGKNYLMTDYGWFELKDELPESYDYYAFDFVENKIDYFDVNSKEFILYVLE